MSVTRAQAEARDAIDELADFRGRFVIAEPGVIYLDGNSLGRLPVQTVADVSHALEEQWGRGLVRSWEQWLDLGRDVGDELAPLIGARFGDVLLADQTSVNLFKLASAALDANPSRPSIVTDAANFPSDRYVLAEVARRAGGELRVVPVADDDVLEPATLADHLDGAVGLVSVSLVAYRSGALLDLNAITDVARDAGAWTLWDLSHAAGAVPLDLVTAGVDLAVGCTYKHLNGGPGAPAFLFVNQTTAADLIQPIQGWFGHADMFGFEARYHAAPDIRRHQVGTPPILSLVAARSGIRLSAEAGIDRIRAKSTSLTELMIDRIDERLTPLGFELTTPRAPERRGAHVTVRHPAAWQITQAAIAEGVIPDHRAPNAIRLGVAPLSTTHVEVFDAVEILAEIVATGRHREFPAGRSGVT